MPLKQRKPAVYLFGEHDAKELVGKRESGKRYPHIGARKKLFVKTVCASDHKAKGFLPVQAMPVQPAGELFARHHFSFAVKNGIRKPLKALFKFEGGAGSRFSPAAKFSFRFRYFEHTKTAVMLDSLCVLQKHRRGVFAQFTDTVYADFHSGLA
jgi:hypothetical protein